MNNSTQAIVSENGFATDCDVAIVGGGLAGLTLALQLIRDDANLRIKVFERRSFPMPEAAHKVGESTVEIGAHYFSHVLGLKQHLVDDQLRKNGLRFFWKPQGPGEGAAQVHDLSEAFEFGSTAYFKIPSYQIDRGRFENYLAEQASARGVEILDGHSVRQVNVADDAPHTVTAASGQDYSCRWLVDASGRAGLVKRELGKAQDNAHDVNAVWFRIDGDVDIGDWSSDKAWHQYVGDYDRRLSTNHLMGRGYWVWLIPLASGKTSIGIVADPRQHDLASMKTQEGALEWLRQHEPNCAQAVEDHLDDIIDFRFLKHYSHAAEQVFSPNRWALTGEAGVFLDPFYSPGSDFIAIANDMICDLVHRDLRGERLGARATAFDQVYQAWYEGALPVYQDLYPMFGSSAAMSLKIVWDFLFYWSMLAPFYFQRRFTDLALMGKVYPLMTQARSLNNNLQEDFRQYGEKDLTELDDHLDPTAVHLLRELNARLLVHQDTPQDFADNLANEVQRLSRCATELRYWLQVAAGENPEPIALTELPELKALFQRTRAAA